MSGNDTEKEPTVIRLPLRELDKTCNAQKKNDFLKAWKLIQELPPTNPNSFWSIATYHGMPFKERRVEDNVVPDETWGGYCQHANVLFPFWHRLYCLRLEQALQSVLEDGQKRVALHYWDASSEESMLEGLPQIVTDENVKIDEKMVPNPLFKFRLPLPIEDNVSNTDKNSQFYKKDAGYETCRYPYSGIRNPDDAKKAALAHNHNVAGENETAQSLLQANIIGWLNKGYRDRKPVFEQFQECLDAADYNPFSNTTSAGPADVSVEQPHNDLHVAIGGFTQPVTYEDGSVKLDAQGYINWNGPIEGANGDMGANEVASFDPVFFLHHSNIDRMFWVWQKKHKKTDPSTFKIGEKDEGTSNHKQGPTPNQTWDQNLGKNTILYPFQDEYGVPRTSMDCINIVSQLDYDYFIGSLDQPSWPEPEEETTISLLDEPSAPWHEILAKLKDEIPKIRPTALHLQGPVPRRQRLRLLFDRTHFTPTVVSLMKVKDINKDKISGSFLVQVFYRAAGKLYYLGQRGVLSRWNRRNCANCQGRKMAHVSIPIGEGDDAPYDPQNLEVHLVHKDGMTGKYVREILAGKDLVVPAAARSAPDEQKPSLRIVGALLQN